LEGGGPHRGDVGIGGRTLLAKYFLKLGERELEAEVEEAGNGLRVNLGDGWREVELQRIGDSPRYSLKVGDRTIDVLAHPSSESVAVVLGGAAFEIATARPRRGRGRGEEDDDAHFVNGRWLLHSPITGSVVEIRVSTGDQVEAGTILMVIEAMKMQNELRSRVGGTVSAINVEKGQRVETGSSLLEVTAPAEGPA
jgi:biotin carboxyl carrier protein